ncbi:MAG: bifunctional folylpolyglutamate synthase/dihydrofolate synthase [Actinomycetota bacterium]|nr:bifunctional folylpolyglutamate synthase/dihydrofolate synthase [Actinomycetota bacterium]
MELFAALAYLDQHTNLEATAGRAEGLSLERMRTLTQVLGDPQTAYPVIHITGTNGKGSTARMVTELLRANGLSVGTYTSPHLEHINERIAWDGVAIDDEHLAEAITAISEVEPLAGITPSYFEILTAAAFRYFADVAVDVAVIEVGMLGRFDATNVADATVAVLTNVGHDHTDGVGAWRAAIAEEKVGIVKPGCTFVLGETDPELRPIFEDTEAAALWVRGEQFDCVSSTLAVGGRLVRLSTPSGVIDDVLVPLHGGHQADNASIALAAAEAFFGRPLDEDVVREAFATVRMPGRFEIVHRDPTVVLDAAHNVDGARACSATLAEEFTLGGSLILVIGTLGGRDPREILEALDIGDVGFLVACTPDSPRAIPGSEIAAIADGMGVVAESVSTVEDAVARALALATADDFILVTGSLYVVGAARTALLAEVDA